MAPPPPTDPMLTGRRQVLRNVSFAPGGPHQTHVGLWMDKYLPEQTAKGGGATDSAKEAKTKLLRQLAGAQVPQGYAEAFQLRQASFQTDSTIFTGKATVQGRLVVGLGEPTPLEVGLHLDHTWGVPVLPGSALKGLASAAAHKLAQDPAWRAPDSPEDPTTGGASHHALFGTTEQAGLVRFHDAWWIPGRGDSSLPIDLDVMTVHHPDYYQGSREIPPSDMDSPTPISFLTVHGSFLVAVEGPPDWCEAALTLLREGLRELGLGAKTNAGYGRMDLRFDQPRARKPLPAELVGLLDAAGWPAFSTVVADAYNRVTTWPQHLRKLTPPVDADIDRTKVRETLAWVRKDFGDDLTATQRKALDRLGRKVRDTS